MKSLVLLTGLALLVSLHDSAAQGAAVIIKQKARQTAGQPPRTAPGGGGGAAQPGQAAAPVARPVLSADAAAARNIAIDLAIIKSRSAVTDDLKQRLTRSLLGAAKGPKPSEAALQPLVAGVAGVVNKYKADPARVRELSAHLLNTMNAAGLADKGLDDLKQRTSDTLVLARVPAKEIETIATELGKVVAELQKNAAK